MFGPWKQIGLFDPDENSLETALGDTGPSMTQQHLGPETDINFIVRKYGLTGEMPVRRAVAEYGEFDEAMDFRTLLDNVKAGEAAFRSVPSDIRSKFNNDAGAFLEWIHEEENYAEAEELGLVPKRDVGAAGVAAPVVAAPVEPVAP